MTPAPQFRQGDVLVARVEAVPGSARPVPRENGRVVLAHGEVTGHAHVVEGPSVELLETVTDTRFLRIMEESGLLVHDEHSTIELPPGDYRVTRQREYTPEEIRVVAD